MWPPCVQQGRPPLRVSCTQQLIETGCRNTRGIWHARRYLLEGPKGEQAQTLQGGQQPGRQGVEGVSARMLDMQAAQAYGQAAGWEFDPAPNAPELKLREAGDG